MKRYFLLEQAASEAQESIVLVYDGKCPVCSAYSRMTRIREDLGGIRLVDARGGGALVDEISAAALDLDEGMVLKVGDRLYHGVDALHVLALLSSKRGWLNRTNRFLFSSPVGAAALYPVLRFCRGLLLRMLGRIKIDNLGRAARNRRA